MPEVATRIGGLVCMTKEEAAPWLAAILDGEGSVSLRPSAQVRFSNSNVFILEQVAYCLDLFGIEYSHHRAGHGVVSIRVTARRNFMRLLECVGDYIVTHKKERLIANVAEPSVPRGGLPCPAGCTCGLHDSARKGMSLPHTRTVDWDAAEAMYVAHVSISEIARRLEASRGQVYKILRGGVRNP